MDERANGGSAAGGDGARGRGLPWRGGLVILALTMGWLLPSSVGSAQTSDSDLCSRLQAAQTRVGDRGLTSDAISSRLERYGCTTSTLGPTTTFVAGSTTTSIHEDCVLPGGGIGPCPTTTIVGPPTTVGPGTTIGPGTTLPGGGATTTTVGPGTTFPGGGTTVPSPSTTLPPCPITTTSSTSIPTTTIPCAP
jgi:hypothetical protein